MSSAKFRRDIKKRNPYYISKHRRYELEHFCLQYAEWKEEYERIDGMKSPIILPSYIKKGSPSDPTAKIAIRKEELSYKIKLVEDTVVEAEPTISQYLMLGVTQGCTFPYLSAKLGMPCGKDMYYDRLRKFYWLLDEKRK